MVLLTKIKSITTCNLQNLIDRKALSVPMIPICQLHLRSKIDWFSEQMCLNNENDCFRSDSMCLLVLSCQPLIHRGLIPFDLVSARAYTPFPLINNSKCLVAISFVWFKWSKCKGKEQIITVGFVCSVGVLTSFLMIHLKLKESKGPLLTFFFFLFVV